MRKRRRLANKLTIMVCAVLVAVSAFFYAPMDVEAQVSYFAPSVSTDNYRNVKLYDNSYIYLKDYIDSDSGFYKVSFDFTSYFESDFAMWLNTYVTTLDSCGLHQYIYGYSSSAVSSFSRTANRSFYVDASASRLDTRLSVFYSFVGASFPSNSSFNVTCSYDVSNVVVEQVSYFDYQSYQDGYNAGYSAGEQVGESNGYNNGYSDGYEVGEQSGYDSGFQAGQESVDTESYYDAGYSAGYDAGYLSGYETGYDDGYLDGFEAGVSEGEITGYEKGYEDALEYYTKGRVSNVPDFSWTGRYYFSGGNSIFDGSVIIPTNYTFLKEKEYNISFDIDWTSRIVSLNNISGTPSFSVSGWEFDLCGVDFDMSSGIGHFSYDFIPATTSNNINMSFSVSSLFFPSDWTTAYSYSRDFSISVKNIVISSKTGRTSAEILEDMERQDLNTQNTIRDGFSDSMNGFDNSQGNAVNDDLSSGLNEYQTAEDSLWATATTGLKDFTFFDFESVPAMITGMSFITSIMGSWFSHAGGASGVGIVLSILFSVMLVAMVLGLYRLYQSKGGRN